MHQLLTSLRDGFANLMTGGGTTADRRAQGFYHLRLMDPAQIEAAYRSSWLMRKVVDRPPYDMTRAWRDWQAEKSDIEKLEAVEKRLGLIDKVKQALVLGRLGGGALILGVNQGEAAMPLVPDRLGANALRYVHAVSRWQLAIGQIDLDPESDLFGQPAYYQLSSARAGQVRIHPSRVIPFRGLQVPSIGTATQDAWFWGDSIIQVIEDAVKNADSAQGDIASLIAEAKIDIVKVKDLMSQATSAEYEKAFLKRMELAQTGKSIHRALILDAEEEWNQRQITWAGIPEVLRTYLAIVAGASDIPATILLGKSPDGMNATGDADFRAYYDSIASRQEVEIRPALEHLDEVLIRSALGKRPDEIGFTWAPLWQMDETQAATVMKTKAEAVKIYVDSGLIPDEALSKGVQNMLVEDGQLPGLDTALAELPEMANPPADEPDPSKLQAENDNTARALERRGAITAEQRDALIRDAEPRTLYVSRKVLNAAEIIRWAKAQGFKTTLPAVDLHVTICYSRTPVDWLKMESAWGDDDEGRMTIPPGGARLLDVFGDTKKAVVLLFNASSLSYRHEDFRRKGASFDFDQYQPHITITYDPGDVDLDEVEPYAGKIVLGPEVFEEVDEEWADKLEEA